MSGSRMWQPHPPTATKIQRQSQHFCSRRCRSRKTIAMLRHLLSGRKHLYHHFTKSPSPLPSMRLHKLNGLPNAATELSNAPACSSFPHQLWSGSMNARWVPHDRGLRPRQCDPITGRDLRKERPTPLNWSR